MNRVATFEKVSFEQYKTDCEKNYKLSPEDNLYAEWQAIRLPERATDGSAGYDFFIPRAKYINGQPKVIVTGIRVHIDPGWVLVCAPKSGLGFKYETRLVNTIGIVDGDYYYSENEGHILAKIASEASFDLNPGEKFMQGVFFPYGITKDDHATGHRNGGFGSTGA